MRIAIIATCGLALLLASSVRAQESSCPEPPPVFSHSNQLSVEASASFLSRLLSGIGLKVSKEVKVDEVISRYPNPDVLLLKIYNIAMQCPIIINSAWNSERKLELLDTLVREMIVFSSTSDPSPAPSFDEGPAAFEISGRYFGTSPARTRERVALVLDIRSGSEGTFVGNLGDPSRPQVSHFIVEGRVIGDAVTFTAREPTGYYDWFINFEGEFTGDSIRGRSRIVSPSQGVAPWEQIEFAASRRSTQSAPSPVAYVDAGPAAQIAQRAERCCMYDAANWCAPWSSRPGRAYENENLTYAELGSACFCPGRDAPGMVSQTCP
jgi:hypothetical protein